MSDDERRRLHRQHERERAKQRESLATFSKQDDAFLPNDADLRDIRAGLRELFLELQEREHTIEGAWNALDDTDHETLAAGIQQLVRERDEQRHVARQAVQNLAADIETHKREVWRTYYVALLGKTTVPRAFEEAGEAMKLELEHFGPFGGARDQEDA